MTKKYKDMEKIARKNVFHNSKKIKGTKINGYDFNKGINYQKIIEKFSTTGFQASNLSKAINILREMISKEAFIFLGYTSNMVSSGLRDVLRYLTENKKINIIVTTAGGIEEDIIKCLGDFVLGDFNADGIKLREMGVNRIGNIFAPNYLYERFEEFFQPILEGFYQNQIKSGKATTPSDIIWKLGEKINNKESIYYWAWKNKIPVYCPAITDGAIGDNIYFFKFKRQDFILDIAEDVKRFNDLTIGLKKSGVIILGGGIVKHSILNANMLRNGADYAIYMNSFQEYDGSDSGALPNEAVSWGKILPNAKSIKVFGDSTILFPILVAESFARG
ncbi:MAG: deoxyhypusine synthase [Candidatus Pacearchaeota archaeon]